MPEHLRDQAPQLSGFLVSAVGVITANQEQIEWWLRCGASLVAIIAGSYSIYSAFKKNKKP